jgi:hypothetical protein
MALVWVVAQIWSFVAGSHMLLGLKLVFLAASATALLALASALRPLLGSNQLVIVVRFWYKLRMFVMACVKLVGHTLWQKRCRMSALQSYAKCTTSLACNLQSSLCRMFVLVISLSDVVRWQTHGP